MSRRPEAAPGTKVFVGNLSWGTDNNSLADAFSQFGEVVDSIVLKDRETGRSRGFGFVTFSSPESASAAVDAMNGQDLNGRNIRVNLANERPAYGGGAQEGGFNGGY
ncbi:hypothetical protein BATDEDRAFT_27077 [Batrachochytrium dendrobatidis JAM81]|uniref:RRM domain-containing protein n=2 Tax=Batrachochytrium dendrobatidis TaxID=109871 RepID=F4P9N8_BATDJ|nr:uncharacterized protein BATDEDRAFT_27077 [Batrachochytrium dendrobatidis JAM81]EGF77951.1 hypothetical protein BATDEDRAFT_27077 [Batrachochytrium dendrobatidis JAM81]KAJ8330289.1 Ribosome-interacting GTPase 2 [Batrachochytrium dendrobatidis]KAK5670295.1 Ribosome-interacting GTPase 2 [Batrachochytrium dendrobatidis]OAJ43905.1 hypothetical protein BDEG_27219 [Batrachochytrium dendrobatidis JEL423]|eukprot:XP_006681369.1 hypothetical protein BATDEDRAFT_27077 [Batrachochytrium dendrobatidis JAM81]